MADRLDIEMDPNLTLRQYYLKLMPKVHPDRNNTNEYRTYYACIAITAILARHMGGHIAIGTCNATNANNAI